MRTRRWNLVLGKLALGTPALTMALGGMAFAPTQGLLYQQVFAAPPGIKAPTLAPTTSAAPTASAASAVALPGSQLESYTAADGKAYFALSLQPQTIVPPADAHDVVVLFDTSASQSGVYRDKALAALEQLAAGLGKNDRVQLMALDLQAIPLTAGFIAPQSAEWKTATAKLRQRVPLGTTDMDTGLSAAVKELSAAAGAKRIIYIGDGANNAGTGGADLNQLVEQSADAQISVTSYAIGPDAHNAFLAVLANQTGGNLLIDGQTLTAQQAGQLLADSSRQPVLWPTAVNLPAGLEEISPRKLPPLRYDRDTVVIGQGKLSQPADLTVTAVSGGQPVELKWALADSVNNEELSFLPELVTLAKSEVGRDLPLLGRAGLLESGRMLKNQAETLSKLSAQALHSGRNDQAKLLADEALRRDPGNVNALAFQHSLNRAGVIRPVAAQLPAGDAPAAGTLAPPPPQPAPPIGPSGDLILRGNPANDPAASTGFVGDVENRLDLIEQKLRGETLQGLQAARGLIGSDPHLAESNLKALLERVDATTDLRAAARSELRELLTKAIREAASRGVEWDAQELERLQRERASQERKEALDQIYARQNRVKQLIERYNVLLAEGRYRDAEMQAARVAFEIEPSPTTSNAIRYANIQGAVAQYHAIRNAHNQAMMDALISVDKSAIPFPDDPPIVYPDADFWRDITARRAKYRAVDLSETGSAEEKINKALDDSTDFDFQQFTLEEIKDYIRDRHKIEVQIDQKALNDENFDTSTKFDKKISGIKLRSALRLVLNDHDLSYLVKNDVLLITTKNQATNDLVVKVYPVADLVIPITNGGGINPFSLGGGNQGGPGGFAGGQGGAGVGGGGGFGGGGFGGGGGGQGGFFNIADPLPLPAGQPGLQAWAVPETLQLKPAAPVAVKPAPAPAALVTPAANPNGGIDLVDQEHPALEQLRQPAQRIVVTPRAGQSVADAWDAYFAGLPAIQGKSEHDPQRLIAAFRQDQQVRETSRQLMKEQKYAETAAMILAALKNGYGQPWMYEGLSLAMIADDQPLAEVERALMSSVDYARTTTDLLYAASYMAKIEGLKPRALKILRRVTELEPNRVEPYQLGLVLAEQTQDLAAVQWTSLGFLERGWTADQIELANQAQRLAVSTLESLKKSGQTAAAEKFQADLHAALERDLIVRVSWTGDADIDLTVEEPAGTSCSVRQPRSLGGGVLVGDSSAIKRGKNGPATSIEDYIVPRGFAGTYRIMLKRVWGQVTSGKVSVEVISNYGTDKEARETQLIPVGEQPVLVVYDLKAGRRLEKLADTQVAVAAQQQAAVAQAVLAQQIGNAQNANSALNNFAANQQLANGGAFPFFARGAVGYQPVITTLPEGTNMYAQAVVSADRRYVRITATPLFSLVPFVQTFNFVAGATGATQNGQQGNSPFPGGGGLF
ncbi:MAG: VWA domain-containing protein [Pirellulales bacterium]|nr:VWA domain-containing protein [Pirellulales bacterium]